MSLFTPDDPYDDELLPHSVWGDDILPVLLILGILFFLKYFA